MKSSWIKPAFAWGVTGAAFFYLYQSVDWSELLHALRNARAEYVSIAIALTVSSYLLRSRRWQLLFLNTKLRYIDAMRVLFLGFFMNNILPARAGELVRAHMGSKVAQTKRTVVLLSLIHI